MTKEPSGADKYREAGVDIKAADDFVGDLKAVTASTARPGADAALGGFGALFDLGATGYRDPLLVAATDGVGTKLKLAFSAEKHHTVGIDLVAMCVNDLIVQGAEPLFFLDYMATGKLDGAKMVTVAKGIAEGCKQAGAALIGGETAEMPGFYQGSEYDLAGFCVGAVEREKLITGDLVASGDVVIGIASSGPHSNGYSLIRKILDDRSIHHDQPAPFDTSKKLIDFLLEPTKIYVRPVLNTLKKAPIKAISHITGGGFLENMPRVLPDTLSVILNADTWDLPGVFGWLQTEGDLGVKDMAQTFNCGIGMVLIVAPDAAQAVRQSLTENNLDNWQIGQVQPKQEQWQCKVTGSAGSWGQKESWSVTDESL